MFWELGSLNEGNLVPASSKLLTPASDLKSLTYFRQGHTLSLPNLHQINR